MAGASQAVEVREAAIQQFEKPEFAEQLALAIPEGSTTPARIIRAARTALLENPAIADADRRSLVQAVLKSAQDGLLPDGREAALVIFGGKVVYMPMVGGFRKIAAEHGWSLSADVVYANDEFEQRLGDTPRLIHNPVRPGAERGEPIAAYARAHHRDGRRRFLVMSREDINRVKDVSRAKGGDLWTKWWDRAWQKTVARALFKELDLDPNDKRVSRVVDESDPVAALYGGRETADADEQHDEVPADAAPTPEPPATATASDEPEDADWTPVDDEPIDPEALQAAARTIVPSGVHKDLSLADVEVLEGGPEWFLTQLKMVAADAPVRPTLELFVRAQLPEQWAAYVEWKAQA